MGVKYEKLVDYHICTESDWEEFAPPAQQASALFSRYKNDPSRSLYCLDWEKLGDELEIWGIQDDDDSY